MLAIGLVCMSVARAQSIGNSVQVYSFGALPDYHNGTNVSLTYAEEDYSGGNPAVGRYWIAAEATTVANANTDEPLPRTTLLMYDLLTGSWISKELPANRLTNPGHVAAVAAWFYPTITTDPYNGGNFLYVTGKENVRTPTHTFAQLEVYRQNRDDFTAAWTRYFPAASTDVEHGRSHLISDPNGSQDTWLCYTRRKPFGSDPLDDVTSIAHEFSDPWDSAAVQELAAVANRIDDHCSQGINENGTRYTVYHTASADAQGNPILTSHALYVDIDIYNPATNTFAILANNVPLPAIVTGGTTWRPDFPVLYEDGGKLVVVAEGQNSRERLLWYTCDAFATGCDATADWSAGAWDVTGEVWQPQVARLGNDLYAIWENANSKIGVGLWCSTGTGWWYNGLAMQLTNYTAYRFGVNAGSATRVLVYDDLQGELVGAFLGNLGGVWNPIRWKYTDPC